MIDNISLFPPGLKVTGIHGFPPGCDVDQFCGNLLPVDPGFPEAEEPEWQPWPANCPPHDIPSDDDSDALPPPADFQDQQRAKAPDPVQPPAQPVMIQISAPPDQPHEDDTRESLN